MNWVQDLLPYAKEASGRTGLPVSIILGQWGLESGKATSWLAKVNNFGGIKFSKYGHTDGYLTRSSDNSKFAKYKDKEQFVKDYTRVINLSYYDNLRKVSKSTDDIYEIAQALEDSPYCYNCSNYAEGVLGLVRAYDLEKYDNVKNVDSPSNKEVFKIDSLPMVILVGATALAFLNNDK